MPNINMADVVNDADFAQAFTITRNSGAWVGGNWIADATEVPGYGIIEPASSRDVQMIPEGDRVTGMMAFWSSAPLYITDAAAQVTSDQITWNGELYRLLFVYPWSDFGYYKAIGARMVGN
jgi:hypothetical protein